MTLHITHISFSTSQRFFPLFLSSSIPFRLSSSTSFQVFSFSSRIRYSSILSFSFSFLSLSLLASGRLTNYLSEVVLPRRRHALLGLFSGVGGNPITYCRSDLSLVYWRHLSTLPLFSVHIAFRNTSFIGYCVPISFFPKRHCLRRESVKINL